MSTMTNTCLAIRESGNIKILTDDRDSVKNALLSFIDTIVTTSGQATYYDTKESQKAALKQTHQAVWTINRGLYGAMLSLPGVTEHNIQNGIMKLLDNPYPDNDEPLLTRDEENALIYRLSQDIKVQRLFKLFGWFKDNRVNNRRTRRLILSSILSSPKLLFWAVKYRKKLRVALTHAWGQKYMTVMRTILSKDEDWEQREKKFVATNLDRYTRFVGNSSEPSHIYEAVCFILGGQRSKWRVPTIKAFYDARIDLDSGGGILPQEVLEGIRSRFHREVPSGRVLELSKAIMTATDKIRIQKTAKKADINIEFDPEKQDLIKLYVYALEDKMTDKIRAALDKKAQKVVERMPVRFDRVGVVLDNSASMYGTDERKNRPLAIGLAMCDILKTMASQAVVRTTNMPLENDGMTTAGGSTSLAESLVDVLEEDQNLEAIYVITDGYENAPAGRLHEVIANLRDIGISTPIFQISPVIAGEAAGVRLVSPLMSPLPVTRPEAIGMSTIRAIIDQGDIERGIDGLLNVVPELENKNG